MSRKLSQTAATETRKLAAIMFTDIVGFSRQMGANEARMLRLPIYLDAKLQSQLERIAQKKGKELSDVVNQLVRKEVELLEELT